jgi:hypothetical protein
MPSSSQLEFACWERSINVGAAKSEARGARRKNKDFLSINGRY